ncbi:hypothetical protein [Dactylosporangium sp. CA-092794]|uniref:hypothetical protein n=1 Tax=Dactylosporangium sp. CA-092794 TaxID=3239929 RepID=UPI003D90E1CD
MRMDLLDRPVVDLAGRPIGRVDGVETVVGRDGTFEIASLLVETPPRMFARTPGPTMRISWDLVAFCDRTITLLVRKDRLRLS